MSRCIYCMEEIGIKLMTCPNCGKRLDDLDSDPRYLKPGSVLQGKYEIGAVIGAGGFGITYIGWDTTLERKVAIKEYYPRQYGSRDDGVTVTASAMNATEKFNAGLDRFLQEAKSLRELQGVEGVVEVDNFFRENGTGYIIMEYLEGKDLKTILREKGDKADYEWTRNIILSILDTLRKIHKKGILHRDIAPDNILITNEGVVKLIDFGAARHEDGIEVENTESLVKPGYSPLEQYTSIAPQGPYTDLYATAAVMYYMLTGKKSPSAIARRDGAALTAPSDMKIKLPEKAEMGMMVCLNIMPEHRLESAEDFMEALDGKVFIPKHVPIQSPVSRIFEDDEPKEVKPKEAEQEEAEPKETVSNKKKFIIIAVFAIALAVATAVLAVVLGSDEPNSGETMEDDLGSDTDDYYDDSDDYDDSSDTDDTDETDTIAESTPEPTSNPLPTRNPNAEPSNSPLPTKNPDYEKNPNLWSAKKIKSHAKKLSTKKKPELRDFRWFLKMRGNDKKIKKFYKKKGFYRIKDLRLIKGGWKGLETWQGKGMSGWDSRLTNVWFGSEDVDEIPMKEKHYKYIFSDGSTDDESGDKPEKWKPDTDLKGIVSYIEPWTEYGEVSVNIKFYQKGSKQYGIAICKNKKIKEYYVFVRK